MTGLASLAPRLSSVIVSRASATESSTISRPTGEPLRVMPVERGDMALVVAARTATALIEVADQQRAQRTATPVRAARRSFSAAAASVSRWSPDRTPHALLSFPAAPASAPSVTQFAVQSNSRCRNTEASNAIEFGTAHVRAVVGRAQLRRGRQPRAGHPRVEADGDDVLPVETVDAEKPLRAEEIRRQPRQLAVEFAARIESQCTEQPRAVAIVRERRRVAERDVAATEQGEPEARARRRVPERRCSAPPQRYRSTSSSSKRVWR